MPTLPHESELRKRIPITTGCFDYFPLALAYVAMVSYLGSVEHNPGQSLHWAREKSAGHADCIGRHLLDRKNYDEGALLEAGQLAWRALANLQLALEELRKANVDIWAPIREKVDAGQQKQHSSSASEDERSIAALCGPRGRGPV